MTIKALYPTVQPTLNLDFAKTKALDPRVTFSRSSTATFVGSDRLIQTAASDAARFDHNPATGESLGLLVEEARTNVIVSSQTFNSGGWILDGASLTANAAAAPDATTTATSIVQGTGNNRAYHFDNSGVLGSKVFSIFAKANAGTSLEIRAVGGMSPNTTATVNLSSGTVSGFTGATVQSYPNGWYRVLLPVTVSIASGSSTYWQILGPASSTYIWGAQLEAGSFPTSYIPTVASTVTRAADVASITGTNFSSWYNASEGTAFVGGRTKRNTVNTAGWASFFQTGAGASNRISIRVNGTNVTSSGSQVAGFTQAFPGYDSPASIVLAYKANDFAQDASYQTLQTDTSGSVPSSIDQLQIGNIETVNSGIGGTISRLTYWPTRLSDATLQAITL